MGTITVVNHISLDGVTQGLGRPDEDTRGGFAYGGWGTAYVDEVVGRAMGEHMGGEGAILLGRRTYEDFAGFWPQQPDNPYTEVLDRTRKYVVSQSLREPLPWRNSNVVDGDFVPAIERLKADVDGTLAVLGSGSLVRSLTEHDLVDEYLLLINPLLLGQGTRLFAERAPRRNLTLTGSLVSPSGVIIATYAVDKS